MSERQGDLAATPCEYGCADGFLYDPRVQGNIVECPNCKGDGSCKCEPWAQRWKAETPERCANCGGLFDPRTVDARRVRPGEVLRDAKPFAAFVADPIAVVVYDYGKLIESEPQMTVFGPFGGWNEAREYRDRLPEEWRREAACVVMRDPSIWPDPKAAL